MTRRSRVRSGIALVISPLVVLLLLLWQRQRHEAAARARAGESAVASVEATRSGVVSEPPQLRPRRVASADAPLLAHEELLTFEGDGAADISALADLTRAYLEKPAGADRDSLGFNEDLSRALTDREVLGEAAIPAGHPVLRDGQLIDRWGTPWHVHPLASDLIELRSAGPDRRLFTDDDLVAQ